MPKTAKLQIRKNKPPTKNKQPLKQLKIANEKKEQNSSFQKNPDKTTNQKNLVRKIEKVPWTVALYTTS